MLFIWTWYMNVFINVYLIWLHTNTSHSQPSPQEPCCGKITIFHKVVDHKKCSVPAVSPGSILVFHRSSSAGIEHHSQKYNHHNRSLLERYPSGTFRTSWWRLISWVPDHQPVVLDRRRRPSNSSRNSQLSHSLLTPLFPGYFSPDLPAGADLVITASLTLIGHK